MYLIPIFFSGTNAPILETPLNYSELNETLPGDRVIKIIRGDADPATLPAIIVISILAVPILLVCIAAVVQNVRARRVKKAVLERDRMKNLDSPHTKTCCGCIVTSRYYYDSRRGFDKLIGDGSESDEGI